MHKYYMLVSFKNMYRHRILEKAKKTKNIKIEYNFLLQQF